MAEEFDILNSVKNALGVTSNYQDDTLNVYIEDVKRYMLDAGVSNALINSSSSAGAISRGVCDLWNYGSGKGQLSTYFYEKVIQLSSEVKGNV